MDDGGMEGDNTGNGSPAATNRHRRYMLQALKLAEQAYEKGEVPVGAVIEHGDRIIGCAHNQVEQLLDATAHAEMIALTAACDSLQSKYLNGATLYVTLEPCCMCAGALVWSKIGRIVFGAMDDKAGACGSLFNIATNRKLNHQAEIIQGVMEADCAYLMNAFFEQKRRSGGLDS